MEKENTYKYKLGDKANMFYDPTNQKKVLPGQIVEFTPKDLTSVRTKSAINSYHLVRVDGKQEDAPPAGDLNLKFTQSYEKGGAEEVLKKFKLGELKDLAVDLGFEIQPEDTKASLVEAIASDLFPEEEE